MSKNWRPPPDWFKRLDDLGSDEVALTNREIADALGLGLDAVRKALVRYNVGFAIQMDQGRPTKRYSLKDLRTVAKEALSHYHGD